MSKYQETKQSANPVRKITKTGKYSYGVTFPKSLVKNLGWRERQKVRVIQEGKKLIVEDWQE